jgi:nitroreductase
MSVASKMNEDLSMKAADTALNLHPILRNRWSPRAFSSESVDEQTLELLFEAARWAPSSSNEQPWRFIVARKENQMAFQNVLSTLVEGNRIWAHAAPVLGIAVANILDSKGQPNRWATHDTGLALASLVVQAEAEGLKVHMMAGFDPDAVRSLFHVPEGYEPITAFAIGYWGDPNSLPEKLKERERARRTRRPLAETVFTGTWNEPAFGEAK